jgi:hypothetical protein
MAAGIWGSGFALCTGRAVPVRRGEAVAGLRDVLPGLGGATIVIASAGCWSAPEHAVAVITECRFQVVISPGFSDMVRNSLINAAILPVSLPAKTIAKLQDTVESDPGIMLTVDAGRGELRAGGALLARFEAAPQAGPRPARPADETAIRAGGEAMARRLLMAQRLLGSASLPGEVRMRMQRRLVAICDAMKAPGADAVRGARRLDRLLIELARMGQPGLAQGGDGRTAAQAGPPGDALSGGRRAP